jgi:pimeloyl-ACP methyl ester carboxylesterase
MTGSYLDLNGAKIHYEEQGSGIPIVLVHGGFTSSARWAPTVPSLADAFRVITPDSRGHGNSDNPSGELSYPQLADDVAALIAELGLVRPIVGGYSDGGQVTLEFGVRHPGVARGLVVGAAYPDFARSGIRDINAAFIGADAAGNPDLGVLDANLGSYAAAARSRHPGGEAQWRALVEQSARMWLDYPGLTPDPDRKNRHAHARLRRRPGRDAVARSGGHAVPDAAERRARGVSAGGSLRHPLERAGRLRSGRPRLRTARLA